MRSIRGGDRILGIVHATRYHILTRTSVVMLGVVLITAIVLTVVALAVFLSATVALGLPRKTKSRYSICPPRLKNRCGNPGEKPVAPLRRSVLSTASAPDHVVPYKQLRSPVTVVTRRSFVLLFAKRSFRAHPPEIQILDNKRPRNYLRPRADISSSAAGNRQPPRAVFPGAWHK